MIMGYVAVRLSTERPTWSRTSTSFILLCGLALWSSTTAAQWRVSVETGVGAKSATVTAVTREVADSVAVDESPVSLVVRCSGRELDAFMTTRDQLDSDTNGDVRVRVQADSLRPRDVRWLATKANTGAFVPTPELRDLIQRSILRAHVLRVNATTLNHGRVTYTFPVAGFRQALDALRDACPTDRGGALSEVR